MDTEEINKLKEEIAKEEADYEINRSYPSDTEQFYNALEQQRQYLSELHRKLRELTPPHNRE